MTSMDKVMQARHKNLLELIARLGGRGAITTIANRLGYSWPGFVSQMKAPPSRSGHRQMTEQTARAIENAFSLPPGSFDTYPLPPQYSFPAPASATAAPRVPAATQNAPLAVLAKAADRAGVTLPADKVAAALRLLEGSGRTDDEYADLVISLVK